MASMAAAAGASCKRFQKNDDAKLPAGCLLFCYMALANA